MTQTPEANFTASPASGTAPLSVAFTDKSVGIVSSWSWSFGDGGSSTSQSPAYTYSSAGTYTVTLTVSNSFGSSSYQTTITVNPARPVANFIASPTSGTIPLAVSFTDRSTGDITSWSWTFGDGGTSTSQNPSHTYTNPGAYTVTLTASGPGGNSNPQTTSITVIPPPPVPNFSASPTNGTAPLTVQFTDASTGSLTSWSWSFGDGATSTSQNPSHTYTNPGTYTVPLTVSGPGGSSNPQTTSITVVPPPPVADFSATPISGTAPLPVQFTDASTGPVTSWSWVFGDGGTSTSQNLSYTYLTSGTYTVSLTAAGPGGSNTNTETNYITVNSPGIDQYTKLMLHLNGPNGGRTFTDSEEIPKTVTGYGNAQTSTAYSEFGGASLELDGSSYLSVPPSTDWNFSGDFTIDFWWYQTGTAGGTNPIIRTGTGYSLVIQTYSGVVYVWISSNGKSWDIASEVKIGTPSGKGFDHYALVRAGNTYYTFQNGVLTNSFANSLPPYYSASNTLYIGDGAAGYLDELRVSNGIARWVSDFNPPSAQYTVGSTPPTAGFSANWTSGPAPLPVQFTDTSTGSVTGWSWNFGDGSTSTAQYPSHVYLNPGTYTVSLTAAGPGGSNTNSETNYVTVSAPSPDGIDQYTKLMLHFNGPNGSRTFTDSEETPKTVTGYGNAQMSTAYSKFGGASLVLDGSSYVSAPPSQDWNFSGDFTIDFWWYQTGTAGSTNPIIRTGTGYSLVIQTYSGVVDVWISSNGTTWDIASEVKIGTPSGTGFDHYALVRAGGTYYTFQNGLLTNSFVNPLPPYYSASNSLYIGDGATGYLDELRVSNGIVRWLSNFIPPGSPYTNGSVPPTAGFSVTSASGPAPLPVQFTDTSTGSVTGWSWDFGDGSTSTAQYPGHTYSSPGTYTVSLTATGPGGSNTNAQTNCVTVSVPSDGIDQYTKLMLHFDGPNGSSTFTDSEETPKTVTGYGNAQISTAYSEFGGASLELNGSSYLSVPPSADWNFSGNFTIDFWWYHTGTAGSINPIMGTGTGYSLVIQDYSGVVDVWISSNGKTWDIANGVKIGTPSGTGFDHYALVRVGNIYNAYQNGVLTNSFGNPLPPYYSASNTLYIGGRAGTDATGYLDEFRISNGVARWLSNFTPPTSEYEN